MLGQINFSAVDLHNKFGVVQKARRQNIRHSICIRQMSLHKSADFRSMTLTFFGYVPMDFKGCCSMRDGNVINITGAILPCFHSIAVSKA